MHFHNFDEMATRCLRDAYKLVRRAHEIVRNPNVEGCRLTILLRRFCRTGHMYILSLKMYTASALTVSGLYGARCVWIMRRSLCRLLPRSSTQRWPWPRISSGLLNVNTPCHCVVYRRAHNVPHFPINTKAVSIVSASTKLQTGCG